MNEHSSSNSLYGDINLSIDEDAFFLENEDDFEPFKHNTDEVNDERIKLSNMSLEINHAKPKIDKSDGGSLENQKTNFTTELSTKLTFPTKKGPCYNEIMNFQEIFSKFSHLMANSTPPVEVKQISNAPKPAETQEKKVPINDLLLEEQEESLCSVESLKDEEKEELANYFDDRKFVGVEREFVNVEDLSHVVEEFFRPDKRQRYRYLDVAKEISVEVPKEASHRIKFIKNKLHFDFIEIIPEIEHSVKMSEISGRTRVLLAQKRGRTLPKSDSEYELRIKVKARKFQLAKLSEWSI